MGAPTRSFDWVVPEGEGMAHIPVPFDQRAAWDRLGHTNQREHAEAIGSAKRAATRDTRLAALMTRLAGLP